MNMRTMITIGVVVVIGGFAIISGLGKTSASSLSVGDCFENPGADGFTSVTDQDCSGPHDIQVFAESDCTNKALEIFAASLDGESFVIPDDWQVGEIGDEGGGGDTLCFIESPSGALVGSVVA